MLMTHIIAVSNMTSVILLLLVMLLAVMLLMSLVLVLLRQVQLHIVPLMARSPIHHDMLPLLMALVIHSEWIVSR